MEKAKDNSNPKADFLSCLPHNSFKYLNIYGPLHSGKTSFLNAVREFHKRIDEDGSDNDYGRHFVIYLDFSDFVAIAYIDAINYFRKKMSELYLLLYQEIQEELRYFETLDRYLDIIEGESDEEALTQSLLNMVRFVRYGQHFDDYYFRPLILIDEISRPLIYAAKYGYIKEMTKFYDEFLNIDHYEMTAGIITTSFAPANTDVHFGLKYIEDVPVNEYEPFRIICEKNGINLVESHREWDNFEGDRYFDKAITLDECFDELIRDNDFSEPQLSRFEIKLSPEARSFVAGKRIWVINQRYDHEKAEKKYRERKRLEYAQPLASGIMIPSPFAGIRKLEMEIADIGGYDRLNSILKALYSKHGKEITSRDIYNDLQNVGAHYINADEVKNTVKNLKDYSDSRKCFHGCWIDVNDSYWAKFDLSRFENERGYGDMALVKTYVSLVNLSEAIHVFDDVVRFLIDNGNHRFHAKISMRTRSDHICLWVARDDFFLLEKYMEKYADILVKPLDFVAYRGKLGITREFHSWSSHNGFISELIETYLRSIDSEDEMDVIEMFSLFVRAWNGDLEEDNIFSKKYRESNAQELIIILESMNVILGNAAIDNDNILLSGDGSTWCVLGESKNWYEVGIKAKRREASGAMPA